MSRSDVVTERRQPVASLKYADVILRECAGNVWRVIVPPNTPLERLEESSFYSVVAERFHAYDELILIDAARTYYRRYLVLQAGAGYVEVHLMYESKLPAMIGSIGETLPSNHRLVYTGPETGWSAIRNSDGCVIIERAVSQTACLQELLQHASLRT